MLICPSSFLASLQLSPTDFVKTCCRGTKHWRVWITFNGPLLLLNNSKPATGSAFSDVFDDTSGPFPPSDATAMPTNGAGILAVYTELVLKKMATITGNVASAVYLNSGTASFAAVRMLNNRAQNAVLVFVNSSAAFTGEFSCSQDVNPLDLDPSVRANSTTCVLAANSSLEFQGPASFVNNVQHG